MDGVSDEEPIFSAISNSARQLYMLLRCISFAPKAQIQISEEGLRFNVEDSSIMEGSAFLEKALFTSFQYNSTANQVPTSSLDNSLLDAPPTFEISLLALLETLQILTPTDPNNTRPPWSREQTYGPGTSYTNPLLSVSGICRLEYLSPGSPFTITLTEPSITTTCALTTYEPAFMTDIPFNRSAVVLKIIMRASALHDALAELTTTSPETIFLSASRPPQHPAFALSASGPLGSATVEFDSNSSKAKPVVSATESFSAQQGPTGPLETFLFRTRQQRLIQGYKFSLVKAAMRAMNVASKVSVRIDEQGVLSLQFMIEVDPGKVSFVDFRFIPLADEDEAVEDDGRDGFSGGESEDGEGQRENISDDE